MADAQSYKLEVLLVGFDSTSFDRYTNWRPCLGEKNHAAMVNSKLNDFIVLFMGPHLEMVWNVQQVENATAHILTGDSRMDHIVAILQELRWPPVPFYAQFRLLGMTFKTRNGSIRQKLHNFGTVFGCCYFNTTLFSS